MSKMWKKLTTFLSTTLYCFLKNVLILSLGFKLHPTMPRFATTTPISWRTKVGTGKPSTTTEQPPGKRQAMSLLWFSGPCLFHSPSQDVGGWFVSLGNEHVLGGGIDLGLRGFGLMFESAISMVIPPCSCLLVFSCKFPLLHIIQWSDSQLNTYMPINRSWLSKIHRWVLRACIPINY